MESNDLFFKITDSVNIPVPLELDTDYEFAGRVCVHSEHTGSKNDGTYKTTYAASFTEGVQLQKGDKVVLAKDKQSNSTRLRKAVYARGHEYEQFMKFLFTKLDDLFEEYERK